MQYKQNTLHIINATKSQEFLEASYKFKGVSHHNAVCEFDYGVAWCNQQGVYMYNGQQVIELTVKEGVFSWWKGQQPVWSLPFLVMVV